MVHFLWINWYRPNRDDLLVWFQIISCLLGIGSLSMAYSLSQAGPIFGFIAFIVAFILNVYPSIILCHCLSEVAPNGITTFSELGNYTFGKYGKIAVEITQMATCIFIPITFLILGGGILLPYLFAVLKLSPSVWIIIMALTLVPAVLVRNLKEAFGIMVFGSLTSITAICIAMIDSMISNPWNIYPETSVEFKNVLPVFGAMSLAYGTAVIIPSLQREHPDPIKMPMNIAIPMAFITILYLLIGFLGYLQYGCASKDNLLLTMTTPWAKVIAYLLMQGHIMVAFVVLVNPAVYHFERFFIRRPKKKVTLKTKVCSNIHKRTRVSSIEGGYSRNTIPSLHIIETEIIQDPISFVEVAGTPRGSNKLHLDEEIEYSFIEMIQSVCLRLFMLGFCVFVALLGQSSFTDIAGFIGATTVSACCIILPCMIYMKIFYKRMSYWETGFCGLVAIISAGLAIYTAYFKLYSIIQRASSYRLFAGQTGEDTTIIDDYPFCPANFIPS